MLDPMPAGAQTRADILAQPQAWADALGLLAAMRPIVGSFFEMVPFEQVLLTGRGSAYFLGLTAAEVFARVTGVDAGALPASEVWLNQDSVRDPEHTLLIAVSRSGETPETCRACTRLRDAGAPVLTISAYPGRTLTTLGDLNLIFPSAQEQSITQTRAFTTLSLATVALAAFYARDEALWQGLRSLPGAVDALLRRHGDTLAALGEDLSIDRFYLLGSGLRYGQAGEISLKLKEMALSHSEPFHTLEFRDGPRSMITPSTLVVGLIADATRAAEMAVLDDMRALGARTLTIGPGGCDIDFDPLGSEIVESLLYVPAGQVLALARALAKGLDPDKPADLDTVVAPPG